MKGKKSNHITIGIIFILVGIVWAGNATGFFDVNLFTEGWWTLFILVPSIVHFICSDQKIYSMEGIAVGAILFANARGYLMNGEMVSLLVASVFVTIGLSMMIGTKKERRGANSQKSYDGNGNDQKTKSDHVSSGRKSYTNSDEFFRQKREEERNHFSYGASYHSENPTAQESTVQKERSVVNLKKTGYESNQEDRDILSKPKVTKEIHHASHLVAEERDSSARGTIHGGIEECPKSMNACLVGKAYNITGEFTGTGIQAVLGNVQLDLRNAKINQDCNIQVNLVLGGVNLYLPENVRVVSSCQNILAEVRDVRRTRSRELEDMPTIYVTGNCILGGLELA